MTALRPLSLTLSTCAAVIIAAGCAVVGPRGVESKYRDAGLPSDLGTTAIESHDLHAACSAMVSELLASPAVAMRSDRPVPFVVDPEFFAFEGSEPFNMAALVDLVRHELQSAGDGSIQLYRLGYHEASANPYVLQCRVTDLPRFQNDLTENYSQIAFEVVDPRTEKVVFTDLYAVKKAAVQDWHDF